MSEPQKHPIPRAIKLTVAVLGIEVLAPAYWAIGELVSIFSGKAPVPMALALFALFAGFAVWILAAAKGLLAGRAWARSSALFWQLVQLAIASESFTGPGGNVWIGSGLIATSVVVLVLLFSKQSLAHTRRDIER
ncbi:MAG: hypothetical protein RL605_5 [Actinomycetota bacterium]|jgi:hypothetical protein